MQTFLPYADITKSVQCLDNKRLGKQRVEAMQILKALTIPNYGWKNHPAVKMWEGYSGILEMYYNCCIVEWTKRGFKNNMMLCIKQTLYNEPVLAGLYIMPRWFGNEKFHSSHRAALLAKDYNWYSQFNWSEEPKIDYFWPSKNGY